MSHHHAMFLNFSRTKLLQLGSRIDDCLGRLTEEQIWARANEHVNSVGNLVLHLCGNANQWLGAGVAGEADQRNRDAEFAQRSGPNACELRQRLEESLDRAGRILESVSSQRLAEQVEIQGYTVTVLEAIYHVVEHFSQHTGQILLLTKQLTAEDLGYYRHLSIKAERSEGTP